MDGGVLLRFSTQICGDFAELFKGRFEVFDDLLGEYVGIREIVGLFEAFISEPEDIETGFIAVDEFFVIVRAPAAVGILVGPGRRPLMAVLGVVALDELV